MSDQNRKNINPRGLLTVQIGSPSAPEEEGGATAKETSKHSEDGLRQLRCDGEWTFAFLGSSSLTVSDLGDRKRVSKSRSGRWWQTTEVHSPDQMLYIQTAEERVGWRTAALRTVLQDHTPLHSTSYCNADPVLDIGHPPGNPWDCSRSGWLSSQILLQHKI